MKPIIIKIIRSITVPFGSVILASVFGALILAVSGTDPKDAYLALLEGAFGDMNAFGRTLEKSTPLVFSGLAIAFALKAGLFNIGAQGQLLFGALASAVAGFGFSGLPPFLHIPIALIFGIIAGALYGSLQGALKAYTGAHEVITGIMLNYVAINITDYMTKGPFKDTTPGNIIPRTPMIFESSVIGDIAGMPLGFFFGIIVAVSIWWFFNRTTIGFEIRTIGSGIHAAKYAGMKVNALIVLTMLVSGALAGMGGAIETLGVVHRFQPGFNIGLGFEGITIALLGRAHPVGVIPAALLVGAMKAGASMMQFSANVSIEIIDIILALILFFVAAEVIIRKVIPGFGLPEEKISLSTGWGKQF